SGGAMNAIELLTQDHEQVMDLFDQIEAFDEDNDAGSESGNREQIYKQISEALSKHTEIEEKVFNPALEKFDEARDVITQPFAEHKEVEQLLAEIDQLAIDDEEFLDSVGELRDKVEQHVDEEEGEIFPKAKELCGKQQLEAMGSQMEQMKRGKSAQATKRK